MALIKHIAMLALAAGMAATGAPVLAEMTEEVLAEAVRQRDYKTLENLLATGARPTGALVGGSSALGWAVQRLDHNAVALLLKSGADPNSKDLYGDPLLSLACAMGDDAIVSALLDAEADARATRTDGITALALCSGTASPKAVRALVAAGADVNAADQIGQTALMHAAAAGANDTVATLIEMGANVSAAAVSGASPLYFALKSGDPKTTTLLMDAGANLDQLGPKGMTLVEAAARLKNLAAMEELIRRGADEQLRDSEGRQIIHMVADEGLAKLVPIAMANGAQIEGMTAPKPLEDPDPQLVSAGLAVPLLPPLPPGVKPPTDRALKDIPRIELAQLLTPSPRTPLMLAASAGSIDTMKALLAAGAKPDARAPDGMNVFLASVLSGGSDVIDFAYSLAPDPNATLKNGRGALHLAVRLPVEQARAVAAHLVKKGVSLDKADAMGVSPAYLVERLGPNALRPVIAELRAGGPSAKPPQTASAN